jgi:secreted PhoX family phosphatase
VTREFCTRFTWTDELEAAFVAASGNVTWVDVPSTKPYRGADTTPFARGEGAWFDAGRQTVFFTTTTDSRVWAFNTESGILSMVYDAPDGGPLREPGNVTVHALSGQVFVAEDSDDLQLVLLSEDGDDWITSPFLQLEGHDSSEIAGPAFSPDATRLYFSSQRGMDGKTGMTFGIAGPF